jgi:hypothetical protein
MYEHPFYTMIKYLIIAAILFYVYHKYIQQPLNKIADQSKPPKTKDKYMDGEYIDYEELK